MATAGELISLRVVEGDPQSRLADVASRIQSVGAHHCAVVDDARRFAGLIRLGDIAGFSQPGNRILADLMSPVHPLIVRSSEPAEAVADLFMKHQLYEAVVLGDTGDYVGIVTAESVLGFVVTESQRKDELLQQERRRVVAATGAKDAFLHSLSHELRTPLNPVLLVASDGAANTSLPDDVREQFELIATHALLEAHLIDGLLDAARAIQGTIRLEHERVDIREMIQRVAADMRLRSSPTGAEVIVEPGEGNACVMGDLAKLEQAFRNLLQGALESSQAGHPVRVSCSNDSPSGKLVVIVGNEAAANIDRDFASALDPILSKDAASLHGGQRKSAMSLSLARAIVLLHSGSIKMGGNAGGPMASFKVELPLAVAG